MTERDSLWKPEVEVIRKAMMERFSDKLSMEEIADFAYSLAEHAKEQSAQIRAILKDWDNAAWNTPEEGLAICIRALLQIRREAAQSKCCEHSESMHRVQISSSGTILDGCYVCEDRHKWMEKSR